jgi:hypothetical protein
LEQNRAESTSFLNLKIYPTVEIINNELQTCQ